ncbi:hypothetical protein HKX48_001150 [Thoreauomyces humboldtii]|nr:hypothetical protein HKX48_001150 [Thoreauomyces humboldtii]
MRTLTGASSASLLANVRKLLPPLTGVLHKGQAGRIGVVGGSEDYTGAPYFAGTTSLKLGADLCHVFCEKTAGQAIKTYSPELMVHPLLLTTNSAEPSTPRDALAKRVSDSIGEMLPRLHVLLIGPGLSRDPLMLAIAANVILAARDANLPIVVDADGLYLVQRNLDVIKGYRRCILTPNVVEFKRLCEAAGVDVDGKGEDDAAKMLGKALGGVTILRKGAVDVISNGDEIIECDAQGSPRRCGGQGDLLSGACATFLAWGHNYGGNAWDHPTDPELNGDEFETRLPLLAAWGASLFARSCSRQAFEASGRSMVTGDMIAGIGKVFAEIFEPKL